MKFSSPLPSLIDEHGRVLLLLLALIIAFQLIGGRGDVVHFLLLLHVPLVVVDVNDEVAALEADRLHPEHAVVVELVPEAGVSRGRAEEVRAGEVLGEVVAAEEALLAEVAAVAAALVVVHLRHVDLHLLRVRRLVGAVLERARLLAVLRPEVHLSIESDMLHCTVDFC